MQCERDKLHSRISDHCLSLKPRVLKGGCHKDAFVFCTKLRCLFGGDRGVNAILIPYENLGPLIQLVQMVAHHQIDLRAMVEQIQFRRTVLYGARQ